MNKQKSSGGQSRQAAPESASKGGATEPDARNVKGAKDAGGSVKPPAKGKGGAKARRKH